VSCRSRRAEAPRLATAPYVSEPIWLVLPQSSYLQHDLFSSVSSVIQSYQDLVSTLLDISAVIAACEIAAQALINFAFPLPWFGFCSRRIHRVCMLSSRRVAYPPSHICLGSGPHPHPPPVHLIKLQHCPWTAGFRALPLPQAPPLDSADQSDGRAAHVASFFRSSRSLSVYRNGASHS